MITVHRRRLLTKADSVLALIDRETEKSERPDDGNKIQEVVVAAQGDQSPNKPCGFGMRGRRNKHVVSTQSKKTSSDESLSSDDSDDMDDLDLDRSSSRPNLLLEFSLDNDDGDDNNDDKPIITVSKEAVSPTKVPLDENENGNGINRVSSEDDLLDFQSNHSHICSMSIDEEDEDGFSFSSYDTNEDVIVDDKDNLVAINNPDEEDTPRQQESSDPNDDDRRVRFGKCFVYIHPMIAGDAIPQVGLPVTLDWKCQHRYEFDMGTDHDSAKPNKSRQDKKVSLYLTSQYRRAMLKEAGYSNRELRLLGKRTIEARTRRQRTLNTMSMEPLHRFMEKLGKKVMLCKPPNSAEAARSQEILQFMSDAGCDANTKHRNTRIYQELSLEMNKVEEQPTDDIADTTQQTSTSSDGESQQITLLGNELGKDAMTSTEICMHDAKHATNSE